MPLDKSGSKESVGHNIRAELAAGKKRSQSVAIALDVQRRAGGNSPRRSAAVKIGGKSKKSY